MIPTLMYFVIHCIYVDSIYSSIVMLLYYCAASLGASEEHGEVYYCVCVCIPLVPLPY